MSSPYGYYGRYAAFPYQLASQFWPIGGSPSFAVALPQPYPNLPQQHNFPYALQNSAYPLQLPPTHFSPLITRTHLAAPPAAPESRPRQSSQHPGNKIQKTDEVRKPAQVIEISDEEEEAKVEKTPPFKIPDVARTVESTSTTSQKRLQNDPNPKSHPTPTPKDPKPKEKPSSKPQKHKPIEKKAKIPEEPVKRTEVVRPAKIQQPRRTFLSQRISSKVQAKRNLYRLSRKEKNVLEITLLRNHVNEILTGPQFQAKIPPFRPAATDTSTLNSMRDALLSRLYHDEEED